MRYGSLLLVCCLGVILGSPPGTQAASDTTTITIDATVQYAFYGALAHSGTFEATGDIEDDGSAQGVLSFWMLFGDPKWKLTLASDSGTLSVELEYWGNQWEITGGTGAYAGATGGGTYTTQWGAKLNWLASKVTWTLTGSVNT